VIAVLGKAGWHDVDPQDPRKKFVQEVARNLQARIPWAARNGAASGRFAEGSDANKATKPSDGSYSS
jgi:hypothetical protein